MQRTTTRAASHEEKPHADHPTISQVHLRVTDRERAMSFYGGLLGFREVRKSGGDLLLSPTGLEPTQIVLTIDATSPPKPAGTTGLYHIAILHAHRGALAQRVRSLIEHEYPLQGASDHGVSEAIYLADPDGNGVELYVDRPRESWPWQNGMVAMVSEPIDINDLLATAEDGASDKIPPEARIGHIHLQVSDLKRSEEFYHGLLGFDVTQRSYPGALFLSKGGYHHHIGLNIWGTRNASPKPPGAIGLMSFSITLPGEEWESARKRLQDKGMESPADGGRIVAMDPDGNMIHLISRQ